MGVQHFAVPGALMNIMRHKAFKIILCFENLQGGLSSDLQLHLLHQLLLQLPAGLVVPDPVVVHKIVVAVHLEDDSGLL